MRGLCRNIAFNQNHGMRSDGAAESQQTGGFPAGVEALIMPYAHKDQSYKLMWLSPSPRLTSFVLYPPFTALLSK